MTTASTQVLRDGERVSLDELKDDELSPGDQLYRTSKKSNGDGTVDVDIYDWDKRGDDVLVEFITPTGEVETEEMDWPKRDDPKKFKFARLCREHGSGIIDADSIKGAEVPADDDGWELDVTYNASLRQRLTSYPSISWHKVLEGFVGVCAVTALVGFPISVIMLLASFLFGLATVGAVGTAALIASIAGFIGFGVLVDDEGNV